MKGWVVTGLVVVGILLCGVEGKGAVVGVVVKVSEEGELEGEERTEEDGFVWSAFRGIPYAKPPLRELRFQRPEKVNPWSGVKKSLAWGPRCIQTFIHGRFYPQGLPESEDCLTLNVFAPKDAAKSPVLFWIHGGGFSAGSAMEYPGVDNLVREGLVVVTVQYRLGVYGFYASSEEGVEGNWALWDLSLALEWVRSNAAAFGGDAEAVTVMGESAGAALASLLSLSPHSRDLFHRLILMSGTGLSPWAASDAVPNASQWLARQLGCDLPSPSQSTACLRSLTPPQIGEAFEKQTGEESAGLGFFPGTKMIFLPRPSGPFFGGESVEELFRSAPPKPTIIGTTRDEVAFFVRPPTPKVHTAWTVYDPTNFTFHRFRQLLRDLVPDRKGPSAGSVRAGALKHYVYSRGEKSDGVFLVGAFIRLLNDALMLIPALDEARRRAERNSAPVWLYEWTHEGYTAHGAELPFLFKRTLFADFPFQPDDSAASSNLVRQFASFASTGSPEAKTWKPLKSDSGDHLEISSTLVASSSYASKSSFDFWREATGGDLALLLRPPYGEGGDEGGGGGEDVDEHGNLFNPEDEVPELEEDPQPQSHHDEL